MGWCFHCLYTSRKNLQAMASSSFSGGHTSLHDVSEGGKERELGRGGRGEGERGRGGKERE